MNAAASHWNLLRITGEIVDRAPFGDRQGPLTLPDHLGWSLWPPWSPPGSLLARCRVPLL
jgi:hypothetical protein